MATRPLTIPPVTSSIRAFWAEHWPFVLFAAALPIGIWGRVVAGWQMPFWFDESFSGTIAAQPDIGGLFTWCLHELTGPGFYMPLWAWARIAGTSDIALRLPSLVFSIATPLILAQFGHRDRRLRLFWATLVLLWAPTLVTATEARPYAQLFLLGSLQAIAFLRIMHAPNRQSAFAWAICTAFMGLTHYHALAIGLTQGIALAIVHRGRVIACWPALAAFLPLAGWISIHLPFVLAFGRRHDAIYGTLGAVVGPHLAFEMSEATVGTIVMVCVVGLGMLLLSKRADIRPIRSPELILALCGVAAIVLEIGAGFVHSGFAARYLTPSMPGVLFGCALWVRRMEQTDGPLVVAVFAVMAAPFLVRLHAAQVNQTIDEKHLYNFEHASDWLAEQQPKRLAFLWSDGVGSISGDRQVSEVAGFFLHRSNIDTTVTVVHPVGDASAALRDAAGNDSHAAILWIGGDQDSRVRTVPHIAEQDPRWQCRDFGGGVATVTACRRG